MFTSKTKVLLILTQDVLDRVRVLAGKATTALKLPVSLQIVLRALIEVGLKRDKHPALRANVEGQAKAVRHQRSVAGRAELRATDRRGGGPEDQRLGKGTGMSEWMGVTVFAAGGGVGLRRAQQPSGAGVVI